MHHSQVKSIHELQNERCTVYSPGRIRLNCSLEVARVSNMPGYVAGLLQGERQAVSLQHGPNRNRSDRGRSPQMPGPVRKTASFCLQPGALRSGCAPWDLSRMVVPWSNCVPAGALDDGWWVHSMGGFFFFLLLPACFNSVWLQSPNIAWAQILKCDGWLF